MDLCSKVREGIPAILLYIGLELQLSEVVYDTLLSNKFQEWSLLFFFFFFFFFFFLLLLLLLLFWSHRGSRVVKVLCYKSEGCWFDPSWCHWNFSLTYFFRSHYGPGVDSASNRNEYQEYFLGVKAAGAWGRQPYHHLGPLSRNLGTLTSWNSLGTSGL